MAGNFERIYAASLEDPESFWGDAATQIVWDEPWDRVLDDTRPPFFRWFTGGKLNTCYNAVDRHIDAGRGDALALIYDSPVTGQKAHYTFRQLQAAVAELAGALRGLGVARGDTVVI
jgi:propionyl-CoA synthetase